MSIFAPAEYGVTSAVEEKLLNVLTSSLSIKASAIFAVVGILMIEPLTAMAWFLLPDTVNEESI